MKDRGKVRNKARSRLCLGSSGIQTMVILLANREKGNFGSSFIGQSFQMQMHSWAGYTGKCVRHVGGNFGDL